MYRRVSGRLACCQVSICAAKWHTELQDASVCVVALLICWCVKWGVPPARSIGARRHGVEAGPGMHSRAFLLPR